MNILFFRRHYISNFGISLLQGVMTHGRGEYKPDKLRTMHD